MQLCNERANQDLRSALAPGAHAEVGCGPCFEVDDRSLDPEAQIRR